MINVNCGDAQGVMANKPHPLGSVIFLAVLMNLLVEHLVCFHARVP